MAWSKRQLVAEAFAELGVPEYEFDLTAEQIQSALRRLDAMLATWNTIGIRIGYNLASDPSQSDLDQPSGLPDNATEAVFLNLALALAPSLGKVVSPETKKNAKAAYLALLSRVASTNVPQMQYPGTLPVGAGWKTYDGTGDPFFAEPASPLAAGPDSELEFQP